MKIKVKAFITSSSEKSLEECQDSFALNQDRGLYAIADGVSQSLLPSVWAKTLTETFVSNNGFLLNSEKNDLYQIYYDNYRENYAQKLSTLAGNEKELLEIQKEEVDFAASTFVGISITNETIKIQCIGDSVIYIYYPELGRVKHLSSMSNGEWIDFGNAPHFFASNGKHFGTPKTKEIEIADCKILMMTDALADWFNKNCNIETIRNVESINSHYSFVDFVNLLRRNRELKDDDTTLLMIDIKESQRNRIRRFHY